MSKFTELTADMVIPAKEETLVLTFRVNQENWLYMPRFILVRRGEADESAYAKMPVNFRVELTTPANPTPLVVEEFSLTTPNIRRGQGYTAWGYQDRCDIYATCDVDCHIQILITCLIDEDSGRVHSNCKPPSGFDLVITKITGRNKFTFGTSDISNDITSWDFGDGTTDSCVATDTVEHAYAAAGGSFTVTATCHGMSNTATVDTNDPPVVTPMLDTVNPTSVSVAAGWVAINLTGSQFASPMLLRFWSASTYMGEWYANVIDSGAANVNIDISSWLVGTGGVDAVIDGLFSNQLQFTVAP